VPLGQKIFAFLLAIAVGAGVFTWQHRRAAQSTNAAVLSFDPSAAQQIDPGLVQAALPAVALGESILTDSVVATLSKPAFLSSSDMNNRIGEFRSRLVLSEPSHKLLRVQFTDDDPARSAATANAVAETLAAWTRASAAAPSPLMQTPSPARAPTQTPSATRPGPSLSASLADLEKQLSTTSRELDQLSSTRSTSSRRSHRGYGYEPASHSEAKQQQLLNTRVRAAEKQLDDLRVQNSASSPGAKARLDEIHQALVSIAPAGAPRQSARARNFKTAGTSARQLREEREELTTGHRRRRKTAPHPPGRRSSQPGASPRRISLEHRARTFLWSIRVESALFSATAHNHSRRRATLAASAHPRGVGRRRPAHTPFTRRHRRSCLLPGLSDRRRMALPSLPQRSGLRGSRPAHRIPIHYPQRSRRARPRTGNHQRRDLLASRLLLLRASPAGHASIRPTRRTHHRTRPRRR
jgi:hypothetical protein